MPSSALLPPATGDDARRANATALQVGRQQLAQRLRAVKKSRRRRGTNRNPAGAGLERVAFVTEFAPEPRIDREGDSARAGSRNLESAPATEPVGHWRRNRVGVDAGFHRNDDRGRSRE